MFSCNCKEFNKCDHFIIKIISRDNLKVIKDGDSIENVGHRIVLYGGLHLGNYYIECSDYTMLFIYKDGVEVKSEVIDNSIEFYIERYKYKVR